MEPQAMNLSGNKRKGTIIEDSAFMLVSTWLSENK